MYRVCNLTHNDPDGIGAAVIVRDAHSLSTEHVTTIFADYSNINRLFLRALRAKNPYNRIIITDISWLPPSGVEYQTNDDKLMAQQYIPRAIQEYLKGGGEIVLLDHHPVVHQLKQSYGKFLSEMSICETRDSENQARAGSELAARYHAMISGKPALDINVMTAFGRLMGDYDVWRNPNGYGGTLAMAVELANDPFGMMEAFEEGLFMMMENAGNRELTLTDVEFKEYFDQTMIGDYSEHALEIFNQEIHKALSSNIQHLPLLREIHCDFFPSLVSQAVYERFGGIVISRYSFDRATPVKVSLRRHPNINIDLGEVAKKLGGGGHKEAAGIGRVKLDDLVGILAYELGLLPVVVR